MIKMVLHPLGLYKGIKQHTYNAYFLPFKTIYKIHNKTLNSLTFIKPAIQNK